MHSLNDQLFLLINANANASPVVISIATIVASDFIAVIPALFVCLWVWGNPERRPQLVATAIAAALALGANQLIGSFWYEPRPFMIGLGRTLIPHSPENSFPSDHTTLFLAVGFGLLTTRAAPGWGKLVVVLGALVAWARVYLGVHFPIDIFASALIAMLFSIFAVFLIRPVRRWIMPLADNVYEAALDALRMPRRLFPRREQ